MLAVVASLGLFFTPVVCAGAPQADLAVAIDASGPPVRGLLHSFEVRVTNLGPATSAPATLTVSGGAGLVVHNVFCADPGICTTRPSLGQLVAGVPVAAMLPGEFFSIIVDTTVPGASSSVSLSARITSGAGSQDGVAANDVATLTQAVVPSTADIVVSNTDSVASVRAGGASSYLVRVFNAGPQPVFGARLTFAVGPGLLVADVTCFTGSIGNQCSVPPNAALLPTGIDLPPLSAGGFFEMRIAARVTATSGSVSSVATVDPSAGVNDALAANNVAVDSNTVDPAQGIGLVLAPAPIPAGGGSSHLALLASLVAAAALARRRR